MAQNGERTLTFQTLVLDLARAQDAQNQVDSRLVRTLPVTRRTRQLHEDVVDSVQGHAERRERLVTATQVIKYFGRGFWAYDVAVGIFIKHLLDAAEKSGEAHKTWLSKAMSDWRVQAVVTEYGFTIDERWSAQEQKAFIAMTEQACAAIEARESIPVTEIVSWPFVDDLRIFPRTNAKELRTAPVVELGRAIVALLLDRLPAAPKSEAWFFGTPEGRSTIKMQPWWDGRW